MTTDVGRWSRRRRLSPIVWRILAVNGLALAIFLALVLFLEDYRRGLIDAELTALRRQAELIATALGEGATATAADGTDIFVQQVSQQMIRRMVEQSGIHARLFDLSGTILVDSRVLGTRQGAVEIQELSPPPSATDRLLFVFAAYDWVAAHLAARDDKPKSAGGNEAQGAEFDEIVIALQGKPIDGLRSLPSGDLMLRAAAPVLRFDKVLGALVLTRDTRDIEAAVLEVRIATLQISGLSFLVTILLSIYLASTIARPLRKLAAAAERVRRDRSLHHSIPDFGNRRDEIGELAAALREMTKALRLRINAIEQFAADVAHEIKNPLSSLRSAV